MVQYDYVAVDPRGSETRGTLSVSGQSEALQRIKEMGLFPTKLLKQQGLGKIGAGSSVDRQAGRRARFLGLPPGRRKVKAAALSVFTRQLATLIAAGMPLLRGLRVLQQQEASRALKGVIADLAIAIENGESLTEALEAHPKCFNRLYINMVKAGEISGALEITLQRLSEFMEKARRIRDKVKSAMFYPCAVLTVATVIVGVLMVFVLPRFRTLFEGLLNGAPLPAFTVLVFHLSDAIHHHFLRTLLIGGCAATLATLTLRTSFGRRAFDGIKLSIPALGPVFRKASISRVTRTLGTLVGSGVPILQALTIVKETAGNSIVARVMETVHDRVKEGDPMAPTLKSSRVFPAIVAGMVDVGEQTGALPELLMKIADNYDEEVDNATEAMTSLLEPVLIVFLAVVVGSIVIAMFLPLVWIMEHGFDSPTGDPGANP